MGRADIAPPASDPRSSAIAFDGRLFALAPRMPLEGMHERSLGSDPVLARATIDVAPDGRPMTTPSVRAPELSVGGCRRHLVVYVEDNASNVALMVDLLADLEGVELLTAPTAEVAIEIVHARRPDVVIMDVNLPGISGIEATRLLAADPETRDIPVVGLSATTSLRGNDDIARAGFRRYLTKPVNVDELTSVLESILAAKDIEAG